MRTVDPYRGTDDDATPIRRSSRFARVGVALGTASVVAALSVWLAGAGWLVGSVPGVALPGTLAVALVLIAVATLVDRIVRARIERTPGLSGRWPIEAARRRRRFAIDAITALFAWLGLALALLLALAMVLP